VNRTDSPKPRAESHDTVRVVTQVRMPHPFVLLTGCIVVATVLSYVLPAGEYERRKDPATGRNVVVAGTYHAVPARPVGPFETLIAVPKGMADAGSVIFLVFLAGGAFSVIDRTGAFRSAVHWLSDRFRHRTVAIVPIVSLLFAAGGAVEGMWEEIVALIPVLLLLARRVGFDALTVVSMSLGAAGIGSTFSPFNPFSVGIAQRLAELPLLSGMWFRMAVLAPALGVWVWGTMRHAARTRVTPEDDAADVALRLEVRHVLTLLALVAMFAVYVFGTLRYSWGFDELSALFLLIGIVAGVVAGLGMSETADAFVEGFKSMAYAAVLIGVARAIFVVLEQGRIVDTIIQAMVTPLAQLPTTLFAIGMSFVQTAIALPVPSSSGRAVLTMPILVPLSDLLGLSRQVTVLAYQYGPGLFGQFSPTDGALMATLALAGVRYEQWVRFTVPLCGALFVLSLTAIGVAVAIGLK
jgi:uncharacterized ion transporter superfamily protein YfcC